MLPERFMLPDDLIPDCRDQKDKDICVAMAITAVLQIIYYKRTGERRQFSPTWGAVMWRSDVEAQKNMASLNPDSALPAMIEAGAVFTEDCPELMENPEAYDYVMARPELKDKALHLVEGFEKINDGSRKARIEAVKTALYENMLPVVAVVEETSSDHFVPIIGWDNDKELFYVMNSWGDKGGAKGLDSYKYEELKRGYRIMPAEAKEEVYYMGNSALVDYAKISPHKNSPRNRVIDTVTIHCYVGQASVQDMGEEFQSEREHSCNYAIAYDGKIALIVDEGDRSWCSSNRDNDHRAITIEVACEPTHPYAVNEAAYNSLIKLLVDVCERNDIKQLLWQGDKSLVGQVDKQNMTVHRWFANKECPGEWLYERHGQIAEEVNRLLSGDKFMDIANHWCRDDINEFAERGIVNGRGDGTFDPDGNITRAEAVRMLKNYEQQCSQK